MNIKEAWEQSTTVPKKIIFKVQSKLEINQTAYIKNKILYWENNQKPVDINYIIHGDWQPVKEKVKVRGWIGFFKDYKEKLVFSDLVDIKEKAENYYPGYTLLGTTYISEEF